MLQTYFWKGDLNANMKVKFTFGQAIILVVTCASTKHEAAWMLPAEPRETVLNLLSVMLYELGAGMQIQICSYVSSSNGMQL